MKTSEITFGIILIGVFVLIFHIAGWMGQIDDRIKSYAEIQKAQSLAPELLRFGREKQVEIDKLKTEYNQLIDKYNELIDESTLLKYYIEYLEEQNSELKRAKQNKLLL